MGSNMQGQPMNPADSNVSTESVTQIDVTEVSTPVAPEKKSGKGMLLGLIFCLILAAGGIGFGIWSMMDGNTQKANYEKQISNLNSQISALQEQAAKGDDTDDVDPADYIYVGEWGLKIKISEGLKKISYKFDNYDGDVLCVNGLASYDGRIPDFADLRQNSMFCIKRQSKDSSTSEGPWNGVGKSNLVFSDDSYNYFINGGYGIFSSENSEMRSLEENSRDVLLEMLNDSENYSEI